MANQYDEYDDDDLTTDDGPSNLRKALKKAEKEKKELANQLNEIQNQLRSQSVKSVLESKGVNSKIAKFIPSDVSTPEQIDAWLTEYADVFGGGSPAQPVEDEEPSEAQIAAQRINNATQTAMTPAKQADQMKLIGDAKSREELDVLIFGSKVNRSR